MPNMEVSIISVAIIAALVLLFLKIPVFISILAGAFIYVGFSGNLSNMIAVQRIAAGIENVPLLAIPFFVFSGVLMNYSGVTKRILDFCAICTAKLWGGLAQVAILLATIMGGLSGSALADAAMEAKMLVPEMRRKGMSNGFSSNVIAFSSLITPLIPPGIAMILYGSIGNISIGKLFMTGLVVGILLCIARMVVTVLSARKRNYTPLATQYAEENRELPKFLPSLKKAFLPLCLPIVIIGGIRFGIFTPTEAGSVAIFYAFALGFFYREFTFYKIVQCIKETLFTTGVVMLIVGSASALAWVLTKERIPQMLTETILALIHNKYLFLITINVFLLCVGMFIEGNAATIVLVPLLVPIARAYGIDDIQFAFIFIFNMAMGSITPPMGTAMFVTCAVTKCKIKDFLKESGPFFLLTGAILLIITYVPIVTTGIVSLTYGEKIMSAIIFRPTQTEQNPPPFSPFPPETFDAGLEWSRSSGFDGVEICIANYNGIDVPAIKQKLDALNLGCSTISTGQSRAMENISLLHEGAALLKAQERMKQHIDASLILGSKVTLGLLRGLGTPGQEKEDRAALARNLEPVIAYAEEKGAKIILECINRYETSLFNDAASTVDFITHELAGTPCVGILWDLFHANIEDDSYEKVIDLMGSRLQHVHVADSNRMFPGYGHTDFAQIAALLKAAGFNGYMSFECFNRPSLEVVLKQSGPFIDSIRAI